MSYILDALRRAESERQRGAVPTLHSQPLPAGPADAARSRHWVWIGAAAALLLLLIATALPWRPPVPPAQPVSPQGQVLPPVAAALPASQPELKRLQPAPAPEPVVAAPAPTAAPAPVPLSALPEELRRQLPALTTSGAMYSETPAQRMLIVNGQLLREGDRLGPELLLEQIQLKSAVLVFKGRRFSISY